MKEKWSVSETPIAPRVWFGKNANGQIYRYSGNNGFVHFSGIDNVGGGLKNLSTYARKRLDGK